MNSDIEIARGTIDIEIEALVKLKDSISQNFIRAVDTILACQGRVIFSGIGKSGHIARKIAASMTSTGTPTYFVHSTEASHGDLGSLTKDDVCILISNSGETKEISDLISFCKRFAIPLIGISSKSESTLIQNADIPLVLPSAPEACPNQLAPTSSTTMTLVLGDALTVALMKRRTFGRHEFSILHPGGALGNQLMQVKHLMLPRPNIPIAQHDTPVMEVVLNMTHRACGLAIVERDSQTIGVISDGDLRRNIDKLEARVAKEVATPDFIYVDPETLVMNAVDKMNEMNIYNLVVSPDGRITHGILRMHDCLRL